MAIKSVFDSTYKNEILQRIDKLQENAIPHWGILKPNQMVKHITEALKLATGELNLPDRSNLFTRTLIRYFVLNAKVPSVERAKKSPISTFPEVDVVKQNIPAQDLQTEKENFKKELEHVLSSKAFADRSPLLGKMSKEDWGRNIYSHANYHLTQFGV